MPENEPPKPGWLIGAPSGERTRRSTKAERRIAASLGGKRIRRSGGAAWSAQSSVTDRADIRTPLLHVEHKRTECKSLSLKRAWLDKVSQGAKRADKDPAVVITFEEDGHPSEDWILIPLSVAQRVLGLTTEEE